MKPDSESESKPELNSDPEVQVQQVSLSVDRGYAWFIVFASFLIQFIGDGVQFSFGIFFVEISREFNSVGKSGVAWIASILIAVMHAAGPIGSILVNKFGCRKVSILGSILATLGFGLSYFARNVLTLYFSLGLIGGLGFGLMYLPAMVIVPQYFEKRRSFAIGIAVCGSGLGTFFFEWIFSWILTEFNWREGLAIGGGFIFCSVPLAIFYRPMKKVTTTVIVNVPLKENNSMTPSKSASTSILVEPEIPLSTSCFSCDALLKIIDLSLLKNPVFLIFTMSDILISAGFIVPYVYLPELEKIEVPNSTRSTLLGIIGVTNVISRLIVGYLSDKPCVNRLYVYNFSLILAGIVTIMSQHPYLSILWWLRGYAALNGTCMGIYVSMKSVILVDLLGLGRFTDAFGLMLLIQSLGFIIGPPVVGFLYDIYGIYTPGFYFAGMCIGISGVILFIIPVVRKRMERSESEVMKTESNEEKQPNS